MNRRWTRLACTAALAASVLAAAPAAADAAGHNPEPLQAWSTVGLISPGARPAWCLAVPSVNEDQVPIPVYSVPCPSGIITTSDNFYINWIATRVQTSYGQVGDISPAQNVRLCLTRKGSKAVLDLCGSIKPALPIGYTQIGAHNAWEVHFAGGYLLSVSPKTTGFQPVTWQKEKPNKYVQVWNFPRWKEANR